MQLRLACVLSCVENVRLDGDVLLRGVDYEGPCSSSARTNFVGCLPLRRVAVMGQMQTWLHGPLLPSVVDSGTV